MIRSADLVATTAADETDKDRGLDVWALADTAALVGEARALRDGLQAFVVLNLADPGVSADNADASAAIAEYSTLTLLPTPLVRRKAFANAAARGISVDELDNIDPKASQELANMVNMVFEYRGDMGSV